MVKKNASSTNEKSGKIRKPDSFGLRRDTSIKKDPAISSRNKQYAKPTYLRDTDPIEK